MMNPGSSYPENLEDDGRELTATKPDKTQFQIMDVMGKSGFSYARILNLSDLRNAKSKDFYSEISSRGHDFSHSIFDGSREKDFENLFVKNIPTIFAWGVNPVLTDLSELAKNRMEVKNPLGIQNKDMRYYHARPHLVSEQKKWVEKIVEQLTLYRP